MNPEGLMLDAEENFVRTIREKNVKLLKDGTLVTIWVVLVAYVFTACVMDFERSRVLFYIAVNSNVILTYYLLLLSLLFLLPLCSFLFFDILAHPFCFVLFINSRRRILALTSLDLPSVAANCFAGIPVAAC